MALPLIPVHPGSYADMLRSLTIYLILFIVVSCQRKDETPPELTMLGPASIQLLIGDPYTDQGATATDNKDGDLTSRIDVAGSVNPLQAGYYSINYSVSDFSGNESKAVRVVTVSNTAAFFDGMYSVRDSVWGGGITVYSDEVNYSTITNDRIVVTKFANQLNAAVYMDYYSVGQSVNVPNQTLICGSVPLSKTFSTPSPGTVISTSPLKFVINYQMVVGMATTSATATYTKQ